MNKLRVIDDLYERMMANGSDPYRIKLVHVRHPPVYLKDEADKYIDELKSENERLSNALDKERSETIKYMDELCNAKNEIERFTIDKRNVELRADIADSTIEKLKKKMDNYHLMSDIRRAKIKELKRDLWLARAARAKTEYQHWILIWHCANTNQYFFINKTRYKHTSKVDRMRYPWEWRDIWNEVENRCIKKAEEYK